MNTAGLCTPPGLARRAGRNALQWRLLLLWMAVLALPTALMAWPLWAALASHLDHSVHAARWAATPDGVFLVDVLGLMGRQMSSFTQAGAAALLLTLALSPLLCGAIVTAARAPAALSLVRMLQGGVHEYGRMGRVLLWSVVPLGLAAGLATGAFWWADHYAETAVLESHADWAQRAAMVVAALAGGLALASLDCARAQLAAFRQRRSAVLAWWHGCRMLVRQGRAVLGHYLGITLAGLALAAALSALRLALPQLGLAWFVLGVVLAQGAVLVLVWMRCARLLALIELARRPD